MARADRWTFLKKTRTVYSDIDMNLAIDPATNQLKVLTNEKDVKQRLRNLILIRPMELPYSYMGSRIQNMLFELVDDNNVKPIQDELTEVIKTFEPAVSAIQVKVDLNPPDANSVRVKLYFDITNVMEQVVLETIIQKVR